MLVWREGHRGNTTILGTIGLYSPGEQEKDGPAHLRQHHPPPRMLSKASLFHWPTSMSQHLLGESIMVDDIKWELGGFGFISSLWKKI